jgi:hypothetical protein
MIAMDVAWAVMVGRVMAWVATVPAPAYVGLGSIRFSALGL